MEDSGKLNRVAHYFVPAVEVVLVAREAIDQELAVAPAVVLHGILDQAASDGDGDDLSLLDDVVNQLPVFRAARKLSTEQVTCWQMDKAVVCDQFGALSALACSRSSAKKYKMRRADMKVAVMYLPEDEVDDRLWRTASRICHSVLKFQMILFLISRRRISDANAPILIF